MACKARNSRRYIPMAFTALIVVAPAAHAQSPGAADKPNTTIPEKQHMGPVDPGKATGGVIKPNSNTDPAMVKKPPPQDPGETPVIPPKGTPGGAPGAQPK